MVNGILKKLGVLEWHFRRSKSYRSSNYKQTFRSSINEATAI